MVNHVEFYLFHGLGFLLVLCLTLLYIKNNIVFN